MTKTKTRMSQRLLSAVDLAIDVATLGEYGLETTPTASPCRERSDHMSDWEAFAAKHRVRTRGCAGRAKEEAALEGRLLR
jgi:hypothetical protein